MKLQKTYIFLIGIVLLAAVLRLWQIASIPASLNIDEQALGYNAYSLLKTGLDEHGKFFPISLESFGDWKLIGYPLISIPLIALAGLNDLTVRLPSAIAGIVQVIFLYFLTLKIFKKNRVALLASLLLAISPWSIYFSRMAYEVNVATTYFLGGLATFLLYVESQKKTFWFIVACLLFAASIFTYHSYIIFAPLFCIGLFFLYREKLKIGKQIYLGFLILAISLFLVIKSVFLSNASKLSDLAVWTDQNTIYNRADVFRTDGSHDKLLGRIFYSKPFAITYQIGQNYLSSFSPSFLFDKGGQKLVNSLGYFGNFYILDSLLFALGIIALASFKGNSKSILLLWLILGCIPSAITKDAPSSTRLFLLLPLCIIILANGLEWFVEHLQKAKWIKVLFFGFIFLYTINVLFFIDAYFVHINYQRALYLHYGYKQIVQVAQKYPTNEIVVIGPENFPYISFLFYMQYDPNQFRSQVVYYPRNHALFDEVQSFGKYHFVDTIDYEHLNPKTLYIDSRGIGKEDMTINLPSGQPIFKYFVKK